MLSETIDAWLRQADSGALPLVYRLISVDPEVVRASLRRRRLPFVEPGAPTRPREHELAFTSSVLIARASQQGMAVAAVSGLAGLLSVPPETAAQAASVVRLAQRLAIVHGVEPGTSRGDLVVWRAVAVGVGVVFPEQGGVSARVSELPRALVAHATASGEVGTGVASRLAASVARSTATAVGGRFTRWIPWIASGVVAGETKERLDRIGARMQAFIVRAADAPDLDPGAVVEAIEVP
jgi:hypothetical protein